MFFSFFFKKKAPKITVGDVVTVKKAYLKVFPVISRSTLLTVQEVQDDKVQVIYMDNSGTNISRKTIPVIALTKVG